MYYCVINTLMSLIKHLFIFSILLLVSCGGDDSSDPVIPEEEPPVDLLDFQDLVFSDEFDGTELNTDIWTYELGDGCPNLCGWGNNELQSYTDREENVSVSDGTLKIKAIREDFGDSQFTSGRIITQGKEEFLYGKIEIRAKMAGNGGTWPALWMLGSDINTVGWPASGEIDIIEYVGNREDHISSAMHWPGNSGGQAPFQGRDVDNAESEFHIYECLWDRDRITFSVDGEQAHFVRNIDRFQPFDKPFFFIFNVAMGGTLGGVVENGFDSSTMEVDYIRVYQ